MHLLSAMWEPVLYQSLTPKEVGRLQRLGLDLNLPEPAILCTRCGFALMPFSDRV